MCTFIHTALMFGAYIVLNIPYFGRIQIDFKDTHREKTPQSKTPTLLTSMNKDIWVVGTSNQLYTRGS